MYIRIVCLNYLRHSLNFRSSHRGRRNAQATPPPNIYTTPALYPYLVLMRRTWAPAPLVSHPRPEKAGACGSRVARLPRACHLRQPSVGAYTRRRCRIWSETIGVDAGRMHSEAAGYKAGGFFALLDGPKPLLNPEDRPLALLPPPPTVYNLPRPQTGHTRILIHPWPVLGALNQSHFNMPKVSSMCSFNFARKAQASYKIQREADAFHVDRYSGLESSAPVAGPSRAIAARDADPTR